MPRRGLSDEAQSAFLLVSELVRDDTKDDEVVARLRSLPGGRAALREAATYVGAHIGNGHPAPRLHRLLRTAAGDVVAPPTTEERGVEAEQRRLSDQPRSMTFRELSERVPALEDLERRARTDPESFLRELSSVERLVGGLGTRGRRFRSTLGMQKAVRRHVGPSAGLSDPVLSSQTALLAVTRHLWEVAGLGGHR